jgi:hypothetical protein
MSDIISNPWDHVATTGQLPDGMNLLKEYSTFKIVKSKDVLAEDRNGKAVKKLRLTGTVQKCDEFNENHRKYSFDIIREAVEAIQPAVKGRKVIGEFDHPCDAKIHMDRASHLMTKVWMDGKNVMGELEVIEGMPCGQMLKALVEAGVTIGISSRGIGDMRPIVAEGFDEAYEVMPGFRFVTWDVVAEPSVKEAELSVLESRQRLSRGRASRQEVESKLLEEFTRVLRG